MMWQRILWRLRLSWAVRFCKMQAFSRTRRLLAAALEERKP